MAPSQLLVNFDAMNPLDYFVIILVTLTFMIGLYQFYLWSGRHFISHARGLKTPIDKWFKYNPSWVWIYVGLYYPVILFSIFSSINMRHFTYGLFSYFILVSILISFYIFFPVKTTARWHEYHGYRGISEKMMGLIRRTDVSANCFPSMHVSVSTLTSLHLMSNLHYLGYWPVLFPVVISLSVLYTKQHYFMDIPLAVILGWVAFKIFQFMYF